MMCMLLMLHMLHMLHKLLMPLVFHMRPAFHVIVLGGRARPHAAPCVDRAAEHLHGGLPVLGLRAPAPGEARLVLHRPAAQTGARHGGLAGLHG